MNPNDNSEMTDEFKLDEDLMEEMEEFETTAVLRDHGAYSSASGTAEMKGLSPSDDFLEDIESPTLTGVFEKD